MAKHSKQERARRAEESERLRQIEAAWVSKTPPATAKAFALAVQTARARPPRERPADMAPGTPPRPPRPGHEPREKAPERRTSRNRD